MSTNRKAVKEFILNKIDFEGYDLESAPKNNNEKVLQAYKIAVAEVGHIHNRQDMIEYWFSGLCSVISLPYLYGEIVPLAVKWGSIPENHNDQQAEKICSNWFRYMAAQFCQMVDSAERRQKQA